MSYTSPLSSQTSAFQATSVVSNSSTMSSPTAISQLEKLRPLGKLLPFLKHLTNAVLTHKPGGLEQFSSARHHLGFYNNVGISASYTCQTPKAPNALKDIIFSALSIVILGHPILSAIPVDEDTTAPFFARLPEINLENVVTFMTRKESFSGAARDIELDSILETQHNISFKSGHGTLSFWRVIILRSAEAEKEFVLSFIFHHALSDGGSGLVFHKDFLSALSTNPAPLSSYTLRTQKHELLPNLELAHPLPISAPSSPPYMPKNLWSAEPVSMPTKGHFQSLVFSNETTARAIQICKDHGTTITATVPVLVATALMQNIPEQFEELECTFAVSVRRWLSAPIDEGSMGAWYDSFSQYYRKENVSQFSWEEARRSRGLIADYLKSGGKQIRVAKFKNIPDMREFFLSRVGKERGTSFDFSNLGSLRPPTANGKEQDWGMGRMVFSRSAFVSGSAIATGAITGPDGCLVLGFCWQEGVVSKDLMRKSIESVRNGMEDIAKTERDRE
jgi:hypothetical protein